MGVLGTGAGCLVYQGGTYAHFTDSTSVSVQVHTARHFPSSPPTGPSTGSDHSGSNGHAHSDSAGAVRSGDSHSGGPHPTAGPSTGSDHSGSNGHAHPDSAGAVHSGDSHSGGPHPTAGPSTGSDHSGSNGHAHSDSAGAVHSGDSHSGGPHPTTDPAAESTAATPKSAQRPTRQATPDLQRTVRSGSDETGRDRCPSGADSPVADEPRPEPTADTGATADPAEAGGPLSCASVDVTPADRPISQLRSSAGPTADVGRPGQ